MMLGEKISDLRKNKGISQELLAEEAKVSLRTIQRIEAGDSIPRPYTLKVIASALHIPIEQLSVSNQSEDAIHEHDLARLRLLNLICLTAIIFPSLNIVVPVLLWRTHKNFPLVNALGRRIISFQILWTMGTLVTLVFIQVLQVGITGSVAVGRFPLTIFLVYLLALVVNFFFIVREAGQVKKDVSAIYSFVPTLF